MLTISVTDNRDDKSQPPIDADKLKIREVILAAIPDCEAQDLLVEVRVDSNPGRKLPTTSSHPVPKDGEVNLNHWHLHIYAIPKEELTFGTIRAISRGVSREVFAMGAVRAYGEFLGAMYDPKSFADAATSFANEAPWAVS